MLLFFLLQVRVPQGKVYNLYYSERKPITFVSVVQGISYDIHNTYLTTIILLLRYNITM